MSLVGELFEQESAFGQGRGDEPPSRIALDVLRSRYLTEA
jgi:hypothetical protein